MDPNAPTRVLVVDDEESLRFFLTRGLRKAGFAVDEAENGTTAIDRLSNVAYDVVLTDIVMPDVSGLDVLSAVHEMDKDAVVILMTAHGTVNNAIDALRLGAFDYLEKPFELKELMARIERGLGRRSVERENRKLRFLVSKHNGAPPMNANEEDDEEDESGLLASRRSWERHYISDLLRRTRGNVTKAAELAKISRPNLHKKMRTLGLNAADFKG
ncbi:MAG: sigma-54-dependent transcriptional regulator [Planctomycetota bacterium]